MEVVHTCPDVKNWSEVLCCTIPTHMNDLEVKVTDRKKFEPVHDKTYNKTCVTRELRSACASAQSEQSLP